MLPVEDLEGAIELANASDFASLTKSASQIAGDWQEAGGQQFAISLNIGQMAADPNRIRELTAQEMKELRDQGYEV